MSSEQNIPKKCEITLEWFDKLVFDFFIDLYIWKMAANLCCCMNNVKKLCINYYKNYFNFFHIFALKSLIKFEVNLVYMFFF